MFYNIYKVDFDHQQREGKLQLTFQSEASYVAGVGMETLHKSGAVATFIPIWGIGLCLQGRLCLFLLFK